MSIDAILVPAGAEYQAVCRGLRQSNSPQVQVFPIPVGIEPLSEYLAKYELPDSVVLMGLCGSLSTQHAPGDVVIYLECVSEGKSKKCDRFLTTQLQEKLGGELVRGLTSDRLIWSATEKRQLGELYAAQVVDMEGVVALEKLSRVGMLRVVSDDCFGDIPDLTPAIGKDGSLLPLPLMINMLRKPVAATRLVWGSLKGLKSLAEVTKKIFE